VGVGAEVRRWLEVEPSRRVDVAGDDGRIGVAVEVAVLEVEAVGSRLDAVPEPVVVVEADARVDLGNRRLRTGVALVELQEQLLAAGRR